jgi:hypothetical protein
MPIEAELLDSEITELNDVMGWDLVMCEVAPWA